MARLPFSRGFHVSQTRSTLLSARYPPQMLNGRNVASPDVEAKILQRFQIGGNED